LYLGLMFPRTKLVSHLMIYGVPDQIATLASVEQLPPYGRSLQVDENITALQLDRNGVEYFHTTYAGLRGANRILDNESLLELFGGSPFDYLNQPYYPMAVPVARATGIHLRKEEDNHKIWLTGVDTSVPTEWCVTLTGSALPTPTVGNQMCFMLYYPTTRAISVNPQGFAVVTRVDN